MSEKKRSPRDIMRPRPTKFGKEQFISDVCNDKYILIVGSEVILNKEVFKEEEGDINKYILDTLNIQLKTTYPTLNAFISSRPSYSTGEDLSGADMIRNLVLPEMEVDGSISNFIDTDDLAPELDLLLRSEMFRFVMTTTIDDCLERLMRDIWGERLRVVNIADDNDWITFQKEFASTRDKTEPTRNVYRYNRPTLFYIFGKVDSDTSKDFLKTENDAIKFIEKWLKTSGDVIEYIKGKRILSLGCKFDDWYFRFFWYIFKRDFSKLGEGEVAISFDDRITSDNNLKKYLERKNIFVHPDARQFMMDINQMLSLDTKSAQSAEFHDIMLHRRGCGEIFLSYCSKNFALASRLFMRLTDMGYQVWFDNESLCGGDYELSINTAINNARVVLILLTPEIAYDMESGHTDNFYNKEWRLAVQTDNKRVLPIAANGYYLRETYHTKTFESIVGRCDGVDLMTDGFEKLVSSIENVRHNNQ